MGWNSLGFSQLTLEYYKVPVAATQAGVSVNPTASTVQFAFAATPTYVPQTGDWVAGSWETVSGNIIFPYSARCLVGPGGTINPGIGIYTVYLKIISNPEIPVLIAGQLEIN